MRFWLNLMFALFLSVYASGQGMEFFHGTFEEAMEEAKAQKKLIFVDAYAVWCGPCKKMTKMVFPNDEVGKFYNANFINMKIDMERGEGLTFRKKFPVRAFPTLMYIDPQGELVQSVTGFRAPEAFISIGQKAVEKYDPFLEYVSKYEEGERDFETVYHYIQSLHSRGESALAAANAYLREQSDLSSEENLKIIYAASSEADSRIFDQMMSHRSAIENLFGPDQVASKIRTACSNTVKKAIEFELKDLLIEAQTKLQEALPKEANRFKGQSSLEFALALKDAETFEEAAGFILNQKDEDGESYRKMAHYVLNYFDDNSDLINESVKWGKKAVSKEKSSENYLMYAQVVQLAGETSQAKKLAKKAMDIAQSKNESVAEILTFINSLENS